VNSVAIQGGLQENTGLHDLRFSETRDLGWGRWYGISPARCVNRSNSNAPDQPGRSTIVFVHLEAHEQSAAQVSAEWLVLIRHVLAGAACSRRFTIPCSM